MSVSPEMGVNRRKETLPFPHEYVGTFSCHGVEPCPPFGEVCAKVNQDRGCVVYPFGMEGQSYDQALFCVYDGHGALRRRRVHVRHLRRGEEGASYRTNNKALERFGG